MVYIDGTIAGEGETLTHEGIPKPGPEPGRLSLSKGKKMAETAVGKTRAAITKAAERLAELVEEVRLVARAIDAEVSKASTVDDLVDVAIGLDGVEDGVGAVAKVVEKMRQGVFGITAEQFIETGTGSITRNGKTVYVATEYWPSYKWKDLLPTGVDPEDERYKSTVAQCREAGKSRMIEAMKADPDLAVLVEETVNSNSLRSKLTGEEAPRDDDDVPILPQCLAEIVELGEQNKLRMRKAAKR